MNISQINSDDFNDWRWQIKNSINSSNSLAEFLGADHACASVLADIPKDNVLPFALTPYFASLMDKSSYCPIFAQIIPSKSELKISSNDRINPLGEIEREKVPHLVHRYPDRVLFLATDRCASYCRFCTRKRFVGQGPTPKKDDHQKAFDYIEKHQEIKEIIFSGGDPLVLSNTRLDELLTRAFSIAHIEFVRIHSRMLSFAPMRIDDELANIFKKFSPLYLVTHFNHPREITDRAIKAIKKLQESGVLILNQSVLLSKINDDKNILSELFRALVKQKVRPYYLHQCDLVEGSAHFRVPIKKALNLIEELRGHISGLCMPTFVIDIPGGHGKVPLAPNPIIREDENFIYLRGYNGGVEVYPKV